MSGIDKAPGRMHYERFDATGVLILFIYIPPGSSQDNYRSNCFRS
jgi:hypothetical protein